MSLKVSPVGLGFFGPVSEVCGEAEPGVVTLSTADLSNKDFGMGGGFEAQNGSCPFDFPLQP